jgi:transcriptional regulator
VYKLPYFTEQDQQAQIEFINKHPFAFMAGCSEDGLPVATQVPVFFEEKNGVKTLTGHIMKNTDHHKAFEKNPNVLCVFTGAHTYVSATWYSNPHQASTWNYMSVHVRGKIRFLDGDALINILQKTSLHFENNNPESTTVYSNLSEEYTSKLIKAIVAFEVEIETMEATFKLSQNRDEESYHKIIEKLEGSDENSRAVAEEMKKRASQLYHKD